MPVSLIEIDVDKVSRDGGYKITISGQFDIGEYHRVYIGPNGDNTDPQALSGVPGSPTDIFPINDETLVCYTPQLAVGTASVYVYEVSTTDDDVLTDVLEVLEPVYHSSVFDIRGVLPRNYALGARRMSELHRIGETEEYPVGLLETISSVLGDSDCEIGGLFQTRLTEALPGWVALSATYTWDGTTTVTTSDTSEVTIGDYIRLDSDGQEFLVINLVTDTSVEIANPDGLTIPTGATQSSVKSLASTTSLPVESTYGFSDSGKIGLQGVVYYYTSKTDTTFDGITHLFGGSSVAGLRITHREEAVVVDLNQDRSGIDLVRRAMLVDYADAEDLNALGRNLGIKRLPFLKSDDQFREIIKYLAYNPKGTYYGIELALTGLIGAGNFEIIEDVIRFPNKVFIKLIGAAAVEAISEGKAFIEGTELQPSTSTTTVDVDGTVVTNGAVGSVTLKDEDHLTDCRNQKPSAESIEEYPGDTGTTLWTFLNGVSETTEVILTSGQYIEIYDSTVGSQPAYRHDLRCEPESYVEVSILQNVPSTASIGGGANDGRQWKCHITDGVAQASWGIYANGSDYDLQLINPDGTVLSGAVGSAITLSTDSWHEITLKKYGEDRVELLVDGNLVQWAAYSSLGIPGVADRRIGFGCNSATLSGMRGRVKQIGWYAKTLTDYWAARGSAGSTNSVFPTIFDNNVSAFQPGDVGKQLVVSGASATNAQGGNNNGVYEITSYVDLDNATVTGKSGINATVTTANPTRVTLPTDVQLQYPDDLGKKITISGSSLGNDGTYVIDTLLDPGTLADLSAGATPSPATTNVCEVVGATFVTETELDWNLDPVFVTDSGMDWVMAGAGSVSGSTLTLRQALYSHPLVLAVRYSQVLSAQLLSGVDIENIVIQLIPDLLFEYYPFYLADPLGYLRDYLDDITAAGVIPDYEIL